MLQKMLERARNLRDRNHGEYDGMTFVKQSEAEEKSANTFIAPKINAKDTNFQYSRSRPTSTAELHRSTPLVNAV